MPDLDVRGPDPLQRLLTEEIALYTRLTELLRNEQQALTQGVADEIVQITAAKGECVNGIQSCENQRQQLLQQTGLDGLLQRQTTDTPLGQSWQQLTTLASQARELNQLNGRIINMRLQRTQEALAVLRNNDSTTPVYGPDGQAQGSGKGRPLTSA